MKPIKTWYKQDGVRIDATSRDTILNKVFAFDRSGQLLFEIGESEDSEARLKSPHGLTVDSEGNLYIADTGNSKIKIFDKAGNFLRIFKIKQKISRR